MNTILTILLLLLLNTILGCLAIYKFLEKITLYDLIISIVGGVFVFTFEVLLYIFNSIEDKTSNIILFRRNKQ